MSTIEQPQRHTAATLRASIEAYDLIRASEGFRTYAYADVAGVLTIGYGHTRGVRAADKISSHEGMIMLIDDIMAVEAEITASVTVPLSQGEYDALVDWIFNLGATKWRVSPALAALNAGDYAGCINHMHRYIDAAGKPRAELIRRRNAEVLIWKNWE